MKSKIDILRSTLLQYAAEKLTEKEKVNLLLQCVSVFRCYLPQQLRQVMFSQPTLLMVINGHKEVKINEKEISVKPGEILLVPAETRLWIGNYPDTQIQKYLGLGFRFDQDALKHFRHIYGTSLADWDISAQWHSMATDSILTLLTQILDWDISYTTDPQLIQHRQVELLLLLAQNGLVGNILLAEHPSWKQRVSQLLAIDPAKHWQIKDVCAQLGISESSLRRKLQDENAQFRELLEEIRLSYGLSLILETEQSIGQIADAVGYQSQSRFGERFKRHFGMTPTELRRTLVA